MMRIFYFILAFISTSVAHGQKEIFPSLQEKLIKYQCSYRQQWNLERCHFKDTVSIEEMKEAFYKYKDTDFSTKPILEGLDTVAFILKDPAAMILSPLKRHPNKEIRECKGYWLSYNHYELGRLWDKKGRLRNDLVQELNDTREEWLDGEIIELMEPRWYMGFHGSPCISHSIFIKGKWVEVKGTGPIGAPDFFTYAYLSPSLCVGNPSWDTFIEDGARLLGQLHGLYSDANLYHEGRVFSVLLYDNTDNLTYKESAMPYRLELLDPQEADKETKVLFDNFKKFVERIPMKTFKPFYTTDFRIMKGRYYRVTVNKCGWLVEDYFIINKCK